MQKNQDLNVQASDLLLKHAEQNETLQGSTQDLSIIHQRLKNYRETTLMKDDQSKFSMACNNVQQNTNLEELTMLALKITEEIKRAQMNAGAATPT